MYISKTGSSQITVLSNPTQSNDGMEEVKRAPERVASGAYDLDAELALP